MNTSISFAGEFATLAKLIDIVLCIVLDENILTRACSDVLHTFGNVGQLLVRWHWVNTYVGPVLDQRWAMIGPLVLGTQHWPTVGPMPT